MALIPCSECGKEISSSAKSCPMCGYKKPSKKTWLWFIVGFIGLFIFFAYKGATDPNIQARQQARQVIAQCWESFERKPLNSEQKTFIASACEKLEDDFITQHMEKP